MDRPFTIFPDFNGRWFVYDVRKNQIVATRPWKDDAADVARRLTDQAVEAARYNLKK